MFGFFSLKLCATMLAATNWPCVSFGFVWRAAKYSVSRASGVVPSFFATPRNRSRSLARSRSTLDGWFALAACADGCSCAVFWAASAVAVASASPNASVTLVVSLAAVRFMDPPSWHGGRLRLFCSALNHEDLANGPEVTVSCCAHGSREHC